MNKIGGLEGVDQSQMPIEQVKLLQPKSNPVTLTDGLNAGYAGKVISRKAGVSPSSPNLETFVSSTEFINSLGGEKI